MENQNGNVENQIGTNDSTDSRNALTDLALTLFQCPDGSLVTNPAQCREGTFSNNGNSFPDVSIG